VKRPRWSSRALLRSKWIIHCFSLTRTCPINHLSVPFYSHQNVGLMGLSLIIQSPLNCDPEPPIGCLLSVRPRVDWKCNSSVPGAWSRDALIVRTRHMVLSEDVLSWLAWLEQSNQCWLKTCRAGWHDLNNQTSVDWRRAELAGLTWTVKPVLTGDVPSWLAWLEQSNGMVYPCQSTIHQASSLLRRRRLFFVRSNHTSPQSTKRRAC